VSKFQPRNGLCRQRSAVRNGKQSVGTGTGHCSTPAGEEGSSKTKDKEGAKLQWKGEPELWETVKKLSPGKRLESGQIKKIKRPGDAGPRKCQWVITSKNNAKGLDKFATNKLRESNPSLILLETTYREGKKTWLYFPTGQYQGGRNEAEKKNKGELV